MKIPRPKKPKQKKSAKLRYNTDSLTSNDAIPFWGLVNITESTLCWEWKGPITGNGYGAYCLNKRNIGAHRAAFFLSFGFSPLITRHSCDNPLCCNPSHLINGDYSDNARDMVLRDRQAKGSKNGRAKLDHDKIRTIRELFKNGEAKRVIARKYGVSDTLIRYIVTNKNWSHVK